MTDVEILRLMTRVLDQYELSPRGIHGPKHWARVVENGRRIAELTGADTEVVELFAVFHDARRVDDGYDPDHGRRGAVLAQQLVGQEVDLSPERLKQLLTACEYHTSHRTHEDVTIASCWDADRLDLGRCGTQPHQSKLAILFDRVGVEESQSLMKWADGRAAFDVQPEWLDDAVLL